MSDDDESGRPAAKRSHPRGIFERPRGSGVWWTRYNDEHGREHREKVGPKGLALKVYQKRKTEIAERRFFPERLRRRDPRVDEFIDDYLTRVQGTLRSLPDQQRCARIWKAVLGDRTLEQVCPADVQRYIAKRSSEVAPASVNREVSFLKRLFKVAIADGLLEGNPVRHVKMLKENNARVRYLADEE